jgi:hypothetical protein
VSGSFLFRPVADISICAESGSTDSSDSPLLFLSDVDVMAFNPSMV